MAKNKEYEFIIQDSKTQKIYDLSEIVVDDINWDSEVQNGASKLTFSYKDGYMFPNGSVVRFKYMGANIFYGFVFKISNEYGLKEVTAYDSLRYFKYKDTKVLKGHSTDKLVREIIAERPNMRVGNIRTTKYTLPNKIEDNKTYLDMIYDSIADTLLATGRKYILYDKFGFIELVEAGELKLPIVLGDKSYALGYSYEISIDGETYNKIKLAKDNKETGTRESYIVQDSKSMAQWGTLQFYDKVDENLNPAQIKEKAEKLLKYYNQEEKTFSIPALGDTRVRGGSGIYIDISELKLKQWAMVKKVSHKFNKGSSPYNGFGVDNMMTDVIKVIVSNYLNYANLSDVVFGTVINANPVKIKLDSNSKLQIEEPFLVITNRFKKEPLKVSEKVALIKAYGGKSL